MRPTIVLVRGAFAESASWDRVIDPLVAEGHRVIAVAPDSFHAVFCRDSPRRRPR